MPIATGLISALSIERERHLNGDLERFCSVAPNIKYFAELSLVKLYYGGQITGNLIAITSILEWCRVKPRETSKRQSVSTPLSKYLHRLLMLGLFSWLQPPYL